MDDAPRRVMVTVDLQLLGPSTYMRKFTLTQEQVRKHVALRSRMSPEQLANDTLQMAHSWPSKLLQVRLEEHLLAKQRADSSRVHQRRVSEREEAAAEDLRRKRRPQE